jgi:hypothetical protein
MTENKIYKIYPSSSGFEDEDGYIVEYESSCLRYLPIAVEADRVPLNPVYGRVGLHHEDKHALSLGDRLLHREQVVRKSYSDKVMYSGRIDFITTDNEIHETKATLSKNFLSSVIKKGQVKLSHMAQVLSYMIHTGIRKGELVTGFYTEKGETFEPGPSRNFTILASDNSTLIDGHTNFPYTIEHQKRYLESAIEVLETGLPHKDRPKNYLSFTGPCRYCPLKELCKIYDKGKISPELFKQEGIDLINHIAKEKQQKTDK